MAQLHRRKGGDGGGENGGQSPERMSKPQEAVGDSTSSKAADGTRDRSDDDGSNLNESGSTVPSNNKMMVWAVLAAVVSALFWLLISPPPMEQIQQDLTSLRNEIADSLAKSEMIQNLQTKIDILEKDLKQRLNESLPAAYLSEEPTRPGYQFKQRGAKGMFNSSGILFFVFQGLRQDVGLLTKELSHTLLMSL